MRLAKLNDKIIGRKLEMPVFSSEGTVVVMQNKNFPQRPVVKIKNAGTTNYVNLMESLNLFIEAVAF